MLSLSDARTLLEQARDQPGLLRCANAVGFRDSIQVGTELQGALGIEGLADRFDVVEGRGTLRGLLVVFPGNAPARELLTSISKRLAASSPHLLWIVFSTDGLHHVGISVWLNDKARVRVHALVADRKRLTESDAQTLCALSSITIQGDVITHVRWTEILGREAITVRFFHALQRVIAGLSASLPDIRKEKAEELALLYVSRLLFLSFIESKGWLNRDFDFLSNSFIQCMTAGGRYHRHVLTPLFFGTLNTPISRRAGRARTFGQIPFLNGGLFGRTGAERAAAFEFPDDALGAVYGDLLTRFRFTTREQAEHLAETAIDPEMLGRSFECLMQQGVRKTTGAYYTPQPIVELVCTNALNHVLDRAGLSPACVAALTSGAVLDTKDGPAALPCLGRIRIIDPACGSGAFLVLLLERLASMRALAGDTRSPGERRREILATSIFGVDLNPTAVWLCELRLWLSVVVETQVDNPGKIPPLPNLDRNIRIGDSLGNAPSGRAGVNKSRAIEQLRRKYVRAAGTKKKLIARMLDRAERQYAISLLEDEFAAVNSERRDLIASSRGRDLFGDRHSAGRLTLLLSTLKTRKRDITERISSLQQGGAMPFSFQTHFPEVMAGGGFDLVVGNPPWVRIHHIAKSSRELFKKTFELCHSGGWAAGAARANAGKGFSNQLDLSALFVERSIAITRNEGTIALLLPSKLWKSLAGGGLRSMLMGKCELRSLHDFAGAKAQFDAAAYPSLLVASVQPHKQGDLDHKAGGIHVGVHRRKEILKWRMSPDLLPLDATRGAPWLLLPEEVRAAFDSLIRKGVALADSGFGRPLLGVKTGCNEAFVVDLVDERDEISTIRAAGREAQIESKSLRKLLRGDSITQWETSKSNQRIVWTHGDDNNALKTLPPLTAAWLARWRQDLLVRSDARESSRWWKLFRTESANSDVNRVVWADIGRAPGAVVLHKNDASIPLNTCYVARCPSAVDARALAALFNSPLIAAWLSVLAEPAQGGYKRYLGWTMACLPIPARWDDVKKDLAKLYDQSEHGRIPPPCEVFERTLSAYDLTDEEVQPLMLWADD